MKRILFICILLCGIFCSCSAPTKLNRQLLSSLKENDYSKVTQLLEKGADANLNVKGESLLFILVSNNQTEASLKAIEKGADVNWMLESPTYDTSIFDLLIKNGNEAVERAVLNSDFNFNDRQELYVDHVLQNYRDGELSLKFTTDFFTDNKVLKDFNDKAALITLIAKYWCDRTPALVEKLYPEYYQFDFEQPVMFYVTAWGNIEGTKYFISKGYDPFKLYVNPEDGEEENALDHALNFKHNITSYHGTPDAYNESDEEVQQQNRLIEYLESLK